MNNYCFGPKTERLIHRIDQSVNQEADARYAERCHEVARELGYLANTRYKKNPSMKRAYQSAARYLLK